MGLGRIVTIAPHMPKMPPFAGGFPLLAGVAQSCVKLSGGVHAVRTTKGMQPDIKELDCESITHSAI